MFVNTILHVDYQKTKRFVIVHQVVFFKHAKQQSALLLNAP